MSQPELCARKTELALDFNPFTPKSDQFQVSPAASPEILPLHTMKILAFQQKWRQVRIIRGVEWAHGHNYSETNSHLAVARQHADLHGLGTVVHLTAGERRDRGRKAGARFSWRCRRPFLAEVLGFRLLAAGHVFHDLDLGQGKIPTGQWHHVQDNVTSCHGNCC